MKGKVLSGALAAALLFGGAGVAFAQTYGTTGSGGSVTPSATTGNSSTSGTGSSTGAVMGTSTGNPNVPNTGAGGDAATTMALLAISGVAAAAGAAFLVRRRSALL
jgi:hypothetical protein